jgi:hypothetical protein
MSLIQKKGEHMKARIEMNKVKAVIFLFLIAAAFTVNAYHRLQPTSHSCTSGIITMPK